MIVSIAMGADYSFYVKTVGNHARAFLALNISAVGSVFDPSIRDGVLRSGMLLYLHLILK